MASLLARDGSGPDNYWSGMNPSGGAAIVFAALFGISALYHAFQLWKYRAWYFSAFVVGAFSKFLTLYTLLSPSKVQ